MASIPSIFPPLFCSIVFLWFPIFFLPSLGVNFLKAQTLLVLFTAESHAPGSVWNKSITK